MRKQHIYLLNVLTTLVFICTILLSFSYSSQVSIMATQKKEAPAHADLNLSEIALGRYRIDSLKQLKNNTQPCIGSWIYTDSFEQPISLEYTSMGTWTFDSKPSIVKETEFTNNKVVIGHNYCNGIDCNTATTDFAHILYSQPGDTAEMCLEGRYYKGNVTISEEMNERSMYILDNWLGRESITMFTCYGECKDMNCSATESRWVVGVLVE